METIMQKIIWKETARELFKNVSCEIRIEKRYRIVNAKISLPIDSTIFLEIFNQQKELFENYPSDPDSRFVNSVPAALYKETNLLCGINNDFVAKGVFVKQIEFDPDNVTQIVSFSIDTIDKI